MITRRNFIAGAAATLVHAAWSNATTVARFQAKQYHNQPADSPLHENLVKMWAAVRDETHGQFVVETFAQDNNISGSDPGALQMLVSGELEFFTLWGAILGAVVPVSEIQALPYIYSSRAQIFHLYDGAFGAYLQTEMKAKGIYGFPGGCFENGFRQISTSTKPIRTVDDLAGMKIRTPDSELFVDFFKTLGAEPSVINFGQLYDALKNGTVDGQDNPLQVTEVNKFFEVQKYLSITNHMWSGFNLLANLQFWNTVPSGIRKVIQRNVVRFVSLQRAEQDRLNQSMLKQLAAKGMVIQQTDTASLRSRLGPFYARWKEHFGQAAWQRLEAQVGKIGD